MFYQDKFDDFILENQICGIYEKDKELVSGRLCRFYVGWKAILKSAYQTRRLISYILDFTLEQGIKVDTFFGIPEGASPFGILTQFEFSKRDSMRDHVIAMGRAKSKKHGLESDQDFVGKPEGKTVFIEDVVTVATNLMPHLCSFLEKGINISGIIVLTNRMERRDDGLSVKEAVEQKMGIPFYQMSSAPEILSIMADRGMINNDAIEEIEKYYKRYGIEEISLRR